jgi:hypothetical protein
MASWYTTLVSFSTADPHFDAQRAEVIRLRSVCWGQCCLAVQKLIERQLPAVLCFGVFHLLDELPSIAGLTNDCRIGRVSLASSHKVAILTVCSNDCKEACFGLPYIGKEYEKGLRWFANLYVCVDCVYKWGQHFRSAVPRVLSLFVHFRAISSTFCTSVFKV